jgi:hypothetical protein
VTEVARGASSMPDADSRAAFLATLRAVIDQRGQRVDVAPDRGDVDVDAQPRCQSTGPAVSR